MSFDKAKLSSVWVCAGCKAVVLEQSTPGDCQKCKQPLFVQVPDSEGAYLVPTTAAEPEAKKPVAYIGGTPGFYDSWCRKCHKKGRGNGRSSSHTCRECSGASVYLS